MLSAERIRFDRALQSVSIRYDGPAARRGGDGFEELLRSEYQRGYDAGSDHVNRQILEQRNEINQMRALLLENAEKALDQAVLEIRGALPGLALQVVRRMIAGIEWDVAGIARMAEDVLIESGVDPSEVELRLNPADLDLLRDLDPSMAERHPGVRLVADGRLERGGCEAITRFGKIDGRLSRKLERLEASMEGSV
ncbi:MAG: FliH/SctL family protein [Opitutaceae bacterium]